MATNKYKQKRRPEKDGPMFELLHAIREYKSKELVLLVEKRTGQKINKSTIDNWRNNKTRYASTRTERLCLKAIDIVLLQVPKYRVPEVKALLNTEPIQIPLPRSVRVRDQRLRQIATH